jgi:hypothetical protein
VELIFTESFSFHKKGRGVARIENHARQASTGIFYLRPRAGTGYSPGASARANDARFYFPGVTDAFLLRQITSSREVSGLRSDGRKIARRRTAVAVMPSFLTSKPARKRREEWR